MISHYPYFSIIIPMHNRERFIARALDSCFNQDFQDYEIVVVDDGSTDGSVTRVQEYPDSRLTLLRHPVNRGVGPARNTGADAARGEWLIFLDSDDELLPGALSTMRIRTGEVGDEIASLRFMVCMENGALSPNPPMSDEIWDYEKYIRAIEKEICGPGARQESLHIIRRGVFDRVRYPEDRGLEHTFNLALVQMFLIRTCPEAVRLYHQDADNQLTRHLAPQFLLIAPDLAKNSEKLLADHGEALRAWAPELYWREISGLVTLYFAANRRREGWRAFLRCLVLRPFSGKLWATVILGLIGPQPLAWVKSRRARMRLINYSNETS